jgi:putative copper resistance protein D
MIVDPLVLTRGLHFAATVLASGTVVFMSMVVPASFDAAPEYTPLRRRLMWLVWAALALCILSGAAWLALVASDILRATLAEVCLHGGLWLVAGNTRFGEIACARLVLALALGLLLLWRQARWLRLAVAGALAGAIALTGHAGATPGAAGNLHLASDIVHLLAAAAWLGALPALSMLLRRSGANRGPATDRLAIAATGRFSRLGMVCVAAIAASGLINSWALLGRPGDLLNTAYGRLLLLKIGLFAAMIAIATVNKYYLTVRLPAASAMHKLARNAVAEILLGIGVLFLAGALGTLSPSGHVHISSAEIPPDAAFVHIHSEQAMADLSIDPGHNGKTSATIRLSREDFTPFTAKSVRLALDPGNAGLPTVERTAVFAADGTWVITELNIPAAGIWTARVIIDAGAEPIVLDAPIVITQCSNEC